MDNEAVETAAVKAIRRYTEENPRSRLSARQKHVLKNELRASISRWRGQVKSPDQIPYERLEMDDLVRYVKNRPIGNG